VTVEAEKKRGDQYPENTEKNKNKNKRDHTRRTYKIVLCRRTENRRRQDVSITTRTQLDLYQYLNERGVNEMVHCGANTRNIRALSGVDKQTQKEE